MRIVVKVGTSTLAHPTGHLNIRHMESLCKVLADIKNAGHAVILVSSELPELLGMSDRIYTICEGAITGEIASRDANQEKLMRLMTTTSAVKS